MGRRCVIWIRLTFDENGEEKDKEGSTNPQTASDDRGDRDTNGGGGHDG